MSRIVISAIDRMSPDLAHLAQALRDMRPAMERVRRVCVPGVREEQLRKSEE